MILIEVFGYDAHKGQDFRQRYIGNDKKKIADRAMAKMADLPQDAISATGKMLGKWMEHDGKTKFHQVGGVGDFDVTISDQNFVYVE